MPKSASTIRDTQSLASLLGLSRWTVSRALNGHAEVNQLTRQRILAAANHEGFSPDPIARSLRGMPSNLVGVCAQDLEDFDLTPKLGRLQNNVLRHGGRAMIEITRGERVLEAGALQHFAALRVRRVVLIGSSLTSDDALLKSLLHEGTRFVHIDPIGKRTTGAVLSDRARAMELLILHLAALGHRRITALGITPTTAYGRLRAAGIRRAVKALDWNAIDAVHWIYEPDAAAGDFAYGERLVARWLREGRHSSALIALNDRVALGAIRALENAKLRVPEDVSVVGYNNNDFASFAKPALTTIDINTGALIDGAIDRLYGATTAHEKTLWIEPQLILRESTGRAKSL